MNTRIRSLPPMMLAGLTLLTLIVLVAVVAPLVLADQASVRTPDIRQGPSNAHLLGTDAFGRDLLARTLVATRLTLLMAAASTLIAGGLGIALGAAAAIGSPRMRRLGGRLVDLLVSYPPLIISVAVIAIFTPGTTSVACGVGIALVPQFARLAQRLAATVLTKDYITVARLLGVRGWRMAVRHVLPNIAAPLLVLLSVVFATSIVALSGLSFIGLGVQQPTFDWGQLLASGLRDVYTQPAASYGPVVAILLTGLAAGLLGDGLDALLQPSGSGRAAKRVAPRPTANSGSDDVAASRASSLVSVRDLRVGVATTAGATPLVRGISLDIQPGETVGLVGESGSGKSLTAMAVARLLPPQLAWSAEVLELAGTDLGDPRIAAPRRTATDIGVVFQDPSSCFNPALRLGAQLTEVARVHRGLTKEDATEEAIRGLTEVRISDPALRMRQYPHELSGGMRQRAMIAMALMSNPKLLIADEPTTALDVTVQADVLRLMKRLSGTHEMAMLLISHDINVVATMCDRTYVMYAGAIVEEVASSDLRTGTVKHPYTKALLAAAIDSHVDVDLPLVALRGRPPRPGEAGPGCAFANRCPLVMERCLTSAPTLVRDGQNQVACHAVTLEPTPGAAR